MFSNLLTRPWYLHAVLSGVLLMLVFYPFYLWPLCFVALVPLGFAVGSNQLSLPKVFLSGFIAFGMLCFTLSFLLSVQFNWLPASSSFVWLVQTTGVLIATVGYGVLFGLFFCVWRLLRSGSVVLSTLTGASLFVTAEYIAQWVMGGYYPGVLAYAISPSPLLVGYISFFGAFAVSFLILLCNFFLAEALLRGSEHLRKSMYVLAGGCAILLIIFLATNIYTTSLYTTQTKLSVASVQIASPSQKLFASLDESGRLTFPWLEGVVREAALFGPDIFLYPDSPVSGLVSYGEEESANSLAVASEDQLLRWVRGVVSPSTTVMLWVNNAKDGEVTSGFQFFTERGLLGEKSKQVLLPFMDYTPKWARKTGVYTGPFDVVPGPTTPALVLGEAAVGALVCSEALHQSRAQEEARTANILIAAGSEAMFVDDGIGIFTLRALQYRATENNIPIMRASLLGPSALIDNRGAIVTELPKGRAGILRGDVLIQKQTPTPFGVWGNIPLALLIMACVGLSLVFRSPRRLGSS